MPETRKRAPARPARPRRAAGGPTARGAAAKRAAGKPAAPRRATAGTLTVVQIGSAIACPRRQRRILRSLGLRGPHDRRQLPDHPSVRGMIAALPHLVRIDKDGAGRRSQP